MIVKFISSKGDALKAFSDLKHVPIIGDNISINGFRFTVTSRLFDLNLNQISILLS